MLVPDRRGWVAVWREHEHRTPRSVGCGTLNVWLVHRVLEAWIGLWAGATGRCGERSDAYVLAGTRTSGGMLKLLKQRAKQAGRTAHLTPHVLRATFSTLRNAVTPLRKV